MDILYTVRDGDYNDELKYSLRSLKNLPHDRVFIVGYKPHWVQNVIYLPTQQTGWKYENTTNNLLMACRHPDLSDDFILMNDDFYITRPIEQLERYNRGAYEPVMNYYEHSEHYGEGMRQTYEYMQKLGFTNILSYELHVPMIINKKKYIDMIQKVRKEAPHISVIHKRSLYGNMYDYGGTAIEDVKVYKRGTNSVRRIDETTPFLSSNDHRINKRSAIGKYLLLKFPDKSPYET